MLRVGGLCQSVRVREEGAHQGWILKYKLLVFTIDSHYRLGIVQATKIDNTGKGIAWMGTKALVVGAALLATAVQNTLVIHDALAAEKPDAQSPETRFYEEVTIIGTREDLRDISGAAHVVGPEALRQFAYSDIQRIARSVPGVSIQVEDGYGLRPNISIRGVASERSGRITLLEDNVLVAPAPYSAPSAYYFPTAGRMAAFEVLKGPSAITQGPYTIGGALNMISTPIPSGRRGALVAEAGEDATGRIHAFYGASNQAGFGFLVETHQWFSDGYQHIDRGGRTGLQLEDYTLKASFAPPDTRHRFDLKLQFATQISDQSYLGLTDTDFDDAPLRRYGLSALDEIDTEHEQVIFRYEFLLDEHARFSATFYNNEHERDWFKTEGTDFDGSDNAQSFSRTSWAGVVQAINLGTSSSHHSAEELQSILHGTLDTPPGSIQLRSNARQYFSRGIQVGFNWDRQFGGASHAVEFGLRFHEDEEDRLQRNSTYHQQDGELLLDDLGMMGNAGNRIQEAQAVALHIQDEIALGRWLISPGLRFESIDQQRTRFETRNGRTPDPASRAPDNLRDTRENQTKVWLSGMGVSFDANERLRLFGGVHKGFTAPTNAPGVREETAVNFEFGLRAHGGAWNGELTGFWSDYDNLLGVCTASSGADCEVGDAFNGDAATVLGLELLFDVDLVADRDYAVSLSVAYTWMDARFDSDIADTAFFGPVGEGDPIPYIPDHQFHATLGFLRGPLDAHVGLHYIDAVCVRASCGAFETTDAAFTVDFSASWALNDRVDLFARIENLTASHAILGRQPYGARPDKDRTAALGVRVGF